jgi:hypothetical protein
MRLSAYRGGHQHTREGGAGRAHRRFLTSTIWPARPARAPYLLDVNAGARMPTRARGMGATHTGSGGCTAPLGGRGASRVGEAGNRTWARNVARRAGRAGGCPARVGTGPGGARASRCGCTSSQSPRRCVSTRRRAARRPRPGRAGASRGGEARRGRRTGRRVAHPPPGRRRGARPPRVRSPRGSAPHPAARRRPTAGTRHPCGRRPPPPRSRAGSSGPARKEPRAALLRAFHAHIRVPFASLRRDQAVPCV